MERERTNPGVFPIERLVHTDPEIQSMIGDRAWRARTRGRVHTTPGRDPIGAMILELQPTLDALAPLALGLFLTLLSCTAAVLALNWRRMAEADVLLLVAFGYLVALEIQVGRRCIATSTGACNCNPEISARRMSPSVTTPRSRSVAR